MALFRDDLPVRAKFSTASIDGRTLLLEKFSYDCVVSTLLENV